MREPCRKHPEATTRATTWRPSLQRRGGAPLLLIAGGLVAGLVLLACGADGTPGGPLPLAPPATLTQLPAAATGTLGQAAAANRAPSPSVSTFSIVGYDPQTGDLGVAVESKFFAVGPVVPFAAAGVGAVATQSFANTSYGPRGLNLLRQGKEPEEVIAALTGTDKDRARRQMGIVDAHGNAATFTGDACLAWAGGRSGDNYAAQGNILAGPQVVDAMAEAFEVSRGDLATRLVVALAAGQAAGGDVRGRQSAALVVVREGGGYGGYDDRYIDLRVDDHPTPIRELQRLLDIRHGQSAAQEAAQHLQAAREATDAEQKTHLQAALAAAETATRLAPQDGWAWLTRAAIYQQLGDPHAAAAAGIHALTVDPWIKTALVQGILGRDRMVEPLLKIDAFRRVWEAIPSRR